MKLSLAYNQEVDITQKGLEYLEKRVPKLDRDWHERAPQRYKGKPIPIPSFYRKAYMLDKIRRHGPCRVGDLVYFEFEGKKWPKRALVAQRANQKTLDDLYTQGYIEDTKYTTRELR